MSQKLYYYIIAITLGLIALYFWTCVFILKDYGHYPYNTARFQNIIAFLIILFHTNKARKGLRIVNFILLPIAIIGLMFLIMHWPFGRLLFFPPSILIIIALFLNNSINSPERFTTYFILIFPLFHLLCFYLTVSRLPVQSSFRLLDFILMGMVSLTVINRLYQLRRQTEVNISD